MKQEDELSSDSLWPILDRYLAGDCTREEAEQVRTMLAADPEAHEMLAELGEMRGVAATRAGAWDVDAMWNRRASGVVIGAEGGSRRPPSAPTTSGYTNRSIRYYVYVVMVVLIAVAGIQYISHDAPASYTTVATTIGQRASTNLPDGTKIVLAPGSSIRYSSNYNSRSREVEIQGEAFFDVIPNTEKPFSVKSGATSARVLGTSFTVRKYRQDENVHVLVVSGKVAVGTATLLRGDMASVSPNGETSFSRTTNPEILAGWTRDTIAFERVPASEVVAIFNRWYGLNLRINPNHDSKELYTGSFATAGRSAADATRFVTLLIGDL